MSRPNDAEAAPWPATELPALADAVVRSDGTATLVGLAVCTADGRPGTVFLPGQTAHFCCEFETLEPIQSPIGGMEFRDASGLVIHGRTSLQQGSAVPASVPAGSRLRFRHTLRLDVAPGEYRFAVGLSSADELALARYRRGDLTHLDLSRLLQVHCRADVLAPFVVSDAPFGRLLHYGVVNLPGACDVRLLAGPQAPGARGVGPDASGTSRLVYLASYPRSGNTWVRNLIAYRFDRWTSSVHPEGDHGNPELFVQYRSYCPPARARLRLASGPILTEELRRQLLARGEHFFVKTHEMPFERYLEGEAVVCIVRHPTATAWSYYNYLRNTGHADITVEDVIEGRIGAGSWSRHVGAWLEAGHPLGSRFAMLHYEALGSDEARACQAMAELTGLPSRGHLPFPGFDYWHEADPGFYRRGETDEWRRHLTGEQVELVRRLHGAMAERLGYRI